MEQAPKCAFVIFGVTGDLTARKLMPAIYHLHVDGGLHPETSIVGYARSDHDNDAIRARMKNALQTYVKDFDEKIWERLEPRISYVRGAYDGGVGFRDLATHLDELGQINRVFYTSTPPAAYTGIVGGLALAGLNKSKEGFVRVVIEKPFGTDLETARKLNKHVLERFSEEQIYRIDHYLAKETAQNLSALRFANTVFQPIWNNKYIDHIQVTMTEPMGVEGRGSFYEEAGVIRDVFQNHLLQLLALVAMEPPSNYDAISVRDEKVKVFRAMQCLGLEDAVMGQYVAGNGHKSYRDEDGVDERSRQATYAAATFKVNNWRWAGVPFYMRSGKRLESKATEIVLRFKKPPHIPFGMANPLISDRLVFRLVPNEGITFRFNAKTPGQSFDMDRVSMNFLYDNEFDRPAPDAYETLLLDSMLGDATLFMRADEVEEQWKIVDPLLTEWENSSKQPAFYSAGSMGPDLADEMLAKENRYWHRPRSVEANKI